MYMIQWGDIDRIVHLEDEELVTYLQDNGLERRKRGTTFREAMMRFALPRFIIRTDEWTGYATDLGNLGGVSPYTHETVNHPRTAGEIDHVAATAENHNAFNIVHLTKDANSYETEAKDHNTETIRIEWGEETRLLLDLYHQYFPLIDPMKKLKKIWKTISMDIENLGILKTPVQCESRFKTKKKIISYIWK
nr:unnamed protein product [Callosobruchus analis]